MADPDGRRNFALLRHKAWFALVGSALLSLNMTSCASPSGPESVEQRFDTYMNAWVERDIDKVWELMSPKLKRGNGNDKDAFRAFVEEQNMYFVDYTRLETKIDGGQARVIADMAITDSAKTEIVEERQRCDLVLHKGSWYVDDCKPLNPPD